MDNVQESKKAKPDTTESQIDSSKETKGSAEKTDETANKLFEEFSDFTFDDVTKGTKPERSEEIGDKLKSEKAKEGEQKSSFRLPTITFENETDRRSVQDTGERQGQFDRKAPLIPFIPGFDPGSLRIGEGRGPQFQMPKKLNDPAAENFYRRDGRPTPTDGRPFLQGLGQFLQNPEVQSRLGQVLNNPEVKRGITEVVNQVGAQVGVHVDSQRGEIDLNMDFDGLYEKSVPKDSPDYNPEAHKMLSHLENVKLTTDRVQMKFDSPQLMTLGDKGIAKLYKLNLGADGGNTSMKYETTPTKLTMTDIKGMNVVDAAGRKLAIHKVVLDSTDPKNPSGSVTIDNPMPKPEFLPDSVPWSDTVTVPMLLPKEQKQELAEKLPGTIKTIDAIVSGAKSGDLTQIIQKLDLQEATGMLGWSMKNKGSIDLNELWKQPNIPDMLRNQPLPNRNNNYRPHDGVRR